MPICFSQNDQDLLLIHHFSTTRNISSNSFSVQTLELKEQTFRTIAKARTDTMYCSKLLLLGAVILAILTQLVASQPTTNVATNTTSRSIDNLNSWASFCNDDDCTEGCGEWVDITNTGCLAENYRRSIKFKSDTGPEVQGGLVYSPGNTCNCQSECDPFFFASGEGCMALNASISYETFSYRLIGHDVLWSCSLEGSNC
ncbi:hypothetical protein N0V82_010090 [Gnomoniopsis sp. IMI 355080]|nr:hypothetical protein N0V82_010090 [Gnomoniopsis sp. IMI 355080]